MRKCIHKACPVNPIWGATPYVITFLYKRCLRGAEVPSRRPYYYYYYYYLLIIIIIIIIIIIRFIIKLDIEISVSVLVISLVVATNIH